MENKASAFKAAARPVFGTVSGEPVKGFRIIVSGKRNYAQLAGLVEQFGGTIHPLTTGRFPELAKITFAEEV